MNSHALENIVFLILIAGRKQKDALLDEISKIDCRVINTIYGKGTIKANCLVEMLGLVSEENKVVITCILPSGKVEDLFSMLLNKFKFGRPNTGIAFTLPISGMSF
jgi:hypothetical protein